MIGIAIYTGARRQGSLLWQQIGTAVIRIGQLVGGVFRVLSPFLNQNGIEANLGSISIGFFNIADAGVGTMSIFASDPESQALFELGDVILAAILASTGKYTWLTLAI